MTNLYHGSVYEQTELKPGFDHTGVLIEWDGTESNKNLYATTSRAEAISQAFASVLEKKFKSIHYKTRGKSIEVKVLGKTRPTKVDFSKIEIFLYTLVYDEKDGWRKVSNAQNGLDNEWKTTRTLGADKIKRMEKIDLNDWLADKRLNIAFESAPIYADW